MIPEAPPRLSTTTETPSFSVRICAIGLTVRSCPPPAAELTMIRKGFCGKPVDPAFVPCACATAALEQTSTSAVRVNPAIDLLIFGLERSAAAHVRSGLSADRRLVSLL